MIGELFTPRQAVLVTAAAGEKVNITAVEWAMPVGEKPPMLALALNNASLTLELLSTSMEFAVAIPGEKLRDAVMLCGSTSGKFLDKFSEANLTQVKAKKIGAPLVLEAMSNLECRVIALTNAGDHTLVTGEVVEAHLPREGKAEKLLFVEARKPRRPQSENGKKPDQAEDTADAAKKN
jgi:flavin reductase (DIM6/NTAB) family NADH-FMN oxidoreductase RutF